jgi:hypothetical protein
MSSFRKKAVEYPLLQLVFEVHPGGCLTSLLIDCERLTVKIDMTYQFTVSCDLVSILPALVLS